MLRTKRKDTLKEILKLNELRTLRLVLFNVERRAEYLGPTGLADQPIHKADFSGLSKLQLSIINLKSYFRGLNNELKLVDNFHRTKTPLEPRYETSNIRPEAKAFFTAVTGQGWKVEEAVYDNHFTWPAPEMEKCNNPKICCFLRDDLSIVVGPSRKLYYPARAKDIPRLEVFKRQILNGCYRLAKK
jgi:hypothetical protein